MTFDVAIIGAGVHGASAAFHLAGRGVRTIVMDRAAAASGPTGRSSAICRAYYTNPFLAELARDSAEMLENFADLTNGRDAGFRRCGYLYLQPPEDGEGMAATAAALADLKIRIEILDEAALRGEFPAFASHGIGWGAWEPDAGYADPVSTTTGLLARAVELGAVAKLGSAVDGIAPGEVTLVDDTRVIAERVLIAAGPWTKFVAGLVGVELPLVAERHHIATFGWGGAAVIPHCVVDLVEGFYLKPEGEDLFLVGDAYDGPRVDPDDYSEEVAPSELDDLAGRAVRRAPGLGEAEARGGWASLYDVSPDWQPVIGEIAPGVFVDCGSSGHGFKLAPALGNYVADLLCGEAVSELEPFHPSRFERGESLAAGFGDARILG